MCTGDASILPQQRAGQLITRVQYTKQAENQQFSQKHTHKDI